MTAAILVFAGSLLLSFVLFPRVIRELRRTGIVGKDLHKPDSPDIVEMGGFAIVGGLTGGIILAVAIRTFFPPVLALNLIETLAILSTILIVSHIGIIDDLIRLPQKIKALTPVFAAFPLIAIRAGDTAMTLPIIGTLDFGLLYPILLIPLGITGAANAVNMLAGFNGLEVGMGVVAIACLSIVAAITGASTPFIILIATLGALIAALKYNWYPAKVFVGDIGTLTIGAIIAATAIVGNMELAGVLLIIPYFIDFVLKALHHFPSSGWNGIYRNGKLYCPKSGPVGFCQTIMKLTGGISEMRLVLTFIAMEATCGTIAILYYARV